eukprot:TRINITY_DN71335_c0_g1_i1.p2 TRINITY_DN71335_c0_g1~~TRINITY_DN71335_c0_g1_i1.p2  ORF type:complete len:200 (-),score=23.40 TRINITY_DN71335_c0_g1_i1:523-1122(-)
MEVSAAKTCPSATGSVLTDRQVTADLGAALLRRALTGELGGTDAAQDDKAASSSPIGAVPASGSLSAGGPALAYPASSVQLSPHVYAHTIAAPSSKTRIVDQVQSGAEAMLSWECRGRRSINHHPTILHTVSIPGQQALRYKVYSQQEATTRHGTPPRDRYCCYKPAKPETDKQKNVRKGKEAGFQRRAQLLRADSRNL